MMELFVDDKANIGKYSGKHLTTHVSISNSIH